MRPYATRRGSPSRGPSPVRKNAGSTVACPLIGTRGVLLPDVVFSSYAPVVLSLSMSSARSAELILSDNTTGAYELNTTSGNKTPRVPINGQATVDPAFFLTGEGPRDGEPRRVAYGRILTAHPQFARATVNYLWKGLFGLGLVEPADSFDLLRQYPATLAAGATLHPTHPQLLAQLASAFTSSGYNLRTILRVM